MRGYALPSAYGVPESVIERIWDRVDVRGPGDCWPWLLSLGSHGYGQVGWKVDGESRNAMTTAHRVAWMAHHGESIPVGMTVDHLCRNRPCCNPAHLRLLSNRLNGRLNGHALKTHCPHGHPYDEANTYVQPSTGHRSCRTCMRRR